MTYAIEKPDSWDSRTAVILAHGAGAGIQTPFMTYFRNELRNLGFLSVQFNFDYIEQKRKMPDPQSKLQARYMQVIDSVLVEHRPQRLIIGGKSMGGRVASYVAGQLAVVGGLIFLGYPLHPPGKENQLRDEHLYKLDAPMLFVSGTRDNFARQVLLEGVIKKIGSRASLVLIEGGDHSLNVDRDNTSLKTAAKAIQEWIIRL